MLLQEAKPLTFYGAEAILVKKFSYLLDGITDQKQHCTLQIAHVIDGLKEEQGY